MNRGSEWRKWDLHVHTPESHNFTGDWEQLKKQLSRAECDVVGINDYFSVAGYKKIKEEISENRLDIGDKKILPVVEMRMTDILQHRDTRTHSGTNFNFHFIFNDSLSIVDIENFIKALPYEGATISEQYQEKEKLAKIKVDFYSTIKVLNNNITFKNNFLVCLPYDEYGGIAGIDPQSDKFIKEEFCKNSHLLGTSNQNQIRFFLWESPLDKEKKPKFLEEDFKKWFGDKKACIKGSDSHDHTYPIGKLKDKNSNPIDKYCWIKADPTFEGLRQVIYEPEDRVKIQANKPDEKSNYFVIDKLKFTDSANSTFGQQEIYLNSNLNSIIGGKSSGKSLLLNAIAKSIDPEQVKKNFENLRLDPYEDIDFEITWKDGINNNLKNPNMDDFNLEKSENNSNRRRVTYLPQLYLNHLAEKDSKDELNELIEKILVQDESFKDFMDNKKLQISDITHEISDNVKKFIDCYQQGLKIKQEKEELGDQDAVKKEIEKLENEKKRLEESSKLSPEQRKTWSQLEAKKKKINATITSLETKSELVEEIKRRINKAVIDLCGDQNSHGELMELLNQYPNDYDDLNKKVSSFQEDFKSLVNRSFQEFLNTTEINKSIEAQKNSLKEIDDKIKPFLRRIDNEKSLQTIIKKYDKEYSKKVKIEEFEKKQKIMRENYKQIKEKIVKGLISRKAIYDEIINKINSTIGSVDEAISLQAQALINKETFPLFAQINKSKVSNLNWYKNIFNEEKYIDFDKVLNLFKIILLKGNRKAYAKVADNKSEEILLKNSFSFESIYEGFAKDTFMLDYDLEYKGDKILKMSPGKKGTVLLILFLKTNTSQYPILIDQPEDNLDNRTIYEEISKFIKNKKKERQIILVSHNPNLVVSTDSENVIVANQSGQEAAKDNEKYKFEYINGAIENSYRDDSQKGILYQQGIKEHICDILEGGKEAFKKRENKYNF